MLNCWFTSYRQSANQLLFFDINTMKILLAFNNQDDVHLSHYSEIRGTNENAFEANLKILIYSNLISKKVDTDTITLNLKFKHQSLLLSLALVDYNGEDIDSNTTSKDTHINRDLFLQALLVKIMKREKRIEIFEFKI